MNIYGCRSTHWESAPLCSLPPSLPWAWGTSQRQDSAVGSGCVAGPTMVGTLHSCHHRHAFGGTCGVMEAVASHLHAHVPLASQRVSAGMLCPGVGGGTGAGAHRCFHCRGGTVAWGRGQGQVQLRSIAGGREEGVGTMWCWHMPRLLMQELGQWDRAQPARMAGHSSPPACWGSAHPAKLWQGLHRQPAVLGTSSSPAACLRCHHPAGDDTLTYPHPTLSRVCLRHPRLPALPWAWCRT